MSQSTDSIFFDECGVGGGGFTGRWLAKRWDFCCRKAKKQLIYFVLASKNSAALFDLMLPMAFTVGKAENAF